MNTIKLCKEYCIGCGLCESELGVRIERDVKGFLRPQFDDNLSVSFLSAVCPVVNCVQYSDMDTEWGKYLGVYEGHALDGDIRTKASSGGVLTALAICLLESKEVDAIIQVKASDEYPTETTCVVSESREQIIACCGSRYSISSPWISLSKLVKEEKTYAVIGKPCDISALRCLQIKQNKYKNIKYFLSFFCAGMPSKCANDRLLAQMGCEKSLCKSLVYRGNGWPGYATAIDKNDVEYKMEYSKAWGEILGRDVKNFCRLCLDGIGVAADIACGDGWYTKDGEPDFTERDGRNVVFARTTVGMDLLLKAISGGYIAAQKWEDIEGLSVIQRYQYVRKATMRAKLMAYRIFGRITPKYNKNILRRFEKELPFKERARIFFGTVKRIVLKKI